MTKQGKNKSLTEMMVDEGATVIRYTRAEAISDGLLRDVSVTAKEAGFSVPVAVTDAVWQAVVETDEMDAREGQSIEGRLWDVLHMGVMAAKGVIGKRVPEDNEMHYPLHVRHGGNTKQWELKAQIHGGDDGEPVMTIMLPHES